MSNIPITITLPEDQVKELHLYVSRRHISKFIAELVGKGLETKKQQLAQEFQEAAQEDERNAEIKLWDTLSGDGLDETNAY
jgi:hypothetical protein